MNEVQALLEKQACWQKTRLELSWPEKIRMAEGVRESALQLHQIQPVPAKQPKPSLP